MKLILAQNGVRNIPDVKAKIGHDLSDCLWSVLILSERYEIDIEQVFVQTMDNLAENIKSQDR